MQKYINPHPGIFSSLISRPLIPSDEMNPIILEVFDKVRNDGDTALAYYTRKFDGIDLNEFKVKEEDLNEAKNLLEVELIDAIDQAYANIYAFHKAQYPNEIKVEIQKGITCWQKPVPIESIGLYIPGGSAPLFSTILMLSIPAKIAGCKNICLCTPPDPEGDIPAVIKYTAAICGINNVYKIGGSQAIAAMAVGTSTIARVDKIFGPGNQYVTAAKMHALQFGIGIDMPAGPSEVLVYADDSANIEYVAADLLSQAEHGSDSQVVLVTSEERLLDKVESEIHKQLNDLPRAAIARQSINNSLLLFIPDIGRAFQFINEYAPEHLIIASERGGEYLDLIKNSGSVFVGNYTPESAGDYASGTNHTLPTARAARSFSGVNLDAYFKKITFQQITRKGLSDLASTITLMARAEGLEGHARAVEIRVKEK